MRAAIGIMAIMLGLAACVPASTGHAPLSHACTTTITGPDGKPQTAVIEADDAGAAALLCDGGVDLAAPAPSAPQPAPKPAAVPAPARIAAPDTPLVHHRKGGPGCGLRMVGGTGYVCAHN